MRAMIVEIRDEDGNVVLSAPILGWTIETDDQGFQSVVAWAQTRDTVAERPMSIIQR
jgi:hypothetical protein